MRDANSNNSHHDGAEPRVRWQDLAPRVRRCAGGAGRWRLHGGGTEARHTEADEPPTPFRDALLALLIAIAIAAVLIVHLSSPAP